MISVNVRHIVMESSYLKLEYVHQTCLGNQRYCNNLWLKCLSASTTWSFINFGLIWVSSISMPVVTITPHTVCKKWFALPIQTALISGDANKIYLLTYFSTFLPTYFPSLALSICLSVCKPIELNLLVFDEGKQLLTNGGLQRLESLYQRHL